MEQQQDGSTLTRRSVVTAGAAAAVGVAGMAGLAGCGGSSSAGTPASTAAAAGAGGAALAALADVPVGGLKVVKDASGAPVVLSQPTAGNVVAFSGKCTHKGCTVGVDATGKGLKCPCHGSTYDGTGKNTGGPAPAALPAVAVKVDGSNIVPA